MNKRNLNFLRCQLSQTNKVAESAENEAAKFNRLFSYADELSHGANKMNLIHDPD